MKCSTCGYNAPDGALACASCGAPFPTIPMKQSQPGVAMQQPQQPQYPQTPGQTGFAQVPQAYAQPGQTPQPQQAAPTYQQPQATQQYQQPAGVMPQQPMQATQQYRAVPPPPPIQADYPQDQGMYQDMYQQPGQQGAKKSFGDYVDQVGTGLKGIRMRELDGNWKSTFIWLLTLLIPIYGIVSLFMIAFGADSPPIKRAYVKAMLVYAVIMGIVGGIMGGIAQAAMLNSLTKFL